MPRDMKEPQSYGSEQDWVTGRTGQQPNDPKATPPASQEEFYSDRREEESSASHQGGEVSDVQKREHASAPVSSASEDDSLSNKGTSQAKRGGFFKERDYPE